LGVTCQGLATYEHLILLSAVKVLISLISVLVSGNIPYCLSLPISGIEILAGVVKTVEK